MIATFPLFLHYFGATQKLGSQNLPAVVSNRPISECPALRPSAAWRSSSGSLAMLAAIRRAVYKPVDHDHNYMSAPIRTWPGSCISVMAEFGWLPAPKLREYYVDPAVGGGQEAQRVLYLAVVTGQVRARLNGRILRLDQIALMPRGAFFVGETHNPVIGVTIPHVGAL